MHFRNRRGGLIGALVGTAIGATAAVVAAPLVIGALGFGAGGIVVGSIASSMMSSAAIANGGAIAAGSLVSLLQTIGVVGLGAVGMAGVGAAGGGFGAALGAGLGVAADRVAGNGQAPADETPRNGADGEAENQGDVAEAMENLNVDESELQPTEELLSIIVSELDGSVRRFAAKSSEPLQGMFNQYYVETGLPPGSVFFEFNGLRLEGSNSPAQLEIEDGNIVKALRI